MLRTRNVLDSSSMNKCDFVYFSCTFGARNVRLDQNAVYIYLHLNLSFTVQKPWGNLEFRFVDHYSNTQTIFPFKHDCEPDKYLKMTFFRKFAYIFYLSATIGLSNRMSNLDPNWINPDRCTCQQIAFFVNNYVFTICWTSLFAPTTSVYGSKFGWLPAHYVLSAHKIWVELPSHPTVQEVSIFRVVGVILTPTVLLLWVCAQTGDSVNYSVQKQKHIIVQEMRK